MHLSKKIILFFSLTISLPVNYLHAGPEQKRKRLPLRKYTVSKVKRTNIAIEPEQELTNSTIVTTTAKEIVLKSPDLVSLIFDFVRDDLTKDISQAIENNHFIKFKTISTIFFYNPNWIKTITLRDGVNFNLLHIVAENYNKPSNPAYQKVYDYKKAMITRALIQRNINIHQECSEFKQTPMLCAARVGNVPVITILAENGADIEVQDSNGQTPLHAAVYYSNPTTIETLVSLGANKDIRDSKGNKPSDYLQPIGWLDCEYKKQQKQLTRETLIQLNMLEEEEEEEEEE